MRMKSRRVPDRELAKIGTHRHVVVVVHDQGGLAPGQARITEQEKVRPQRATQKPHPIKVKAIIFKDVDVCAGAHATEIVDEFWHTRYPRKSDTPFERVGCKASELGGNPFFGPLNERCEGISTDGADPRMLSTTRTSLRTGFAARLSIRMCFALESRQLSICS